MSIEFGLFIGGWVPDYLDGRDDAREHQRLLDEVRIVQAGDRTGWKYAWVTEHHFLTEYSHISANEIVIPHLLATTSRIRVASGIMNITPPVNHPARLAERVAMLDHLSGGRFDFGTGRGSSTTEQGGFGITDPDLTKAMFDEVMPEFKKMWAQDSYSFDGRFFSMPERNVLPKPHVKPHPPMWVAAGNPDTFRKAGELGLGVLCFTGGSPERMRGAVEVYKEAVSGCTEPVGEYVNDNIAISTSFLCLEDGDRARQHMTTSRNGRQQSLVFKYLDTFPKPPGIPDWPTEIPDPTLEQLAAGARKGTSIVGTPDDCAEALEKWDAIGVDQLIMGPTGSTWPYELVEESVELFGTEVVPRFDPDPEPRSARWRRLAGERLAPTPVD